MSISEILLIAVAGVIGGAINSIAGGGTIILFPALIFAGIPHLIANATCTVSVFPGALASMVAYRRYWGAVGYWLRTFGPVCILGGLAGAVFLTMTPDQLFADMAPFLVLFATVLFMGHGLLRRWIFGDAPPPNRTRNLKWLLGAGIFQLLVGVYGGYFGAGIGILMLASYGILGFRDIHEMNTLKVILSAMINCAAAILFIFTLPIAWKAAGILVVGIIIGSYGGAALAQKIPQKAVRIAIVVIGLVLTILLYLDQRFGLLTQTTSAA